ncbi:MAG: hypothetical protein H6Q26_1081 [Bacteroidetes bacterium]|nr:hypothetical protein [Bacteroidota bacterium]
MAAISFLELLGIPPDPSRQSRVGWGIRIIPHLTAWIEISLHSMVESFDFPRANKSLLF